MNQQYTLRKSASIGLSAVALSMIAFSAQATELIMNGELDRSSTTANAVYINSYPANDIPSWTVSGTSTNPNFNAVSIYDNDIHDSALPAYMPASYYSCTSASGFVSGNSCLNPNGNGYFINLDGDPAFPAAISQTISGLVKDQLYELTFGWAAVQRNDQFGSTTEWLNVKLGTSLNETTPIIGLPSGGFSGWFTTSYDFTFDGGSSLLTFLAGGTPSGLPPSINLDSISLTTVPEPTTYALLGIGLLGALFARTQKKCA